MVALVPMTALEFDEFVRVSVESYADSKSRAGQWTSTDALEQSRQEFQRILPNGAATAGHLFFTIRRDDGLRVGSIWLALPPARGPRGAYIYEISIDEPHRRHGYAEGALRAVEAISLEHGQSTIELNVFGFNAGAQALYAKIGYEVVATYMRKTLGAATSASGAPSSK
ncbi:MAG: GNAT family N-acetyltransferase [Thermoplasmata archaeon]|nr:GNAT family N-acetyltransferase [Thermoplasmata archaeon]